jgi:hypothetical protein
MNVVVKLDRRTIVFALLGFVLVVPARARADVGVYP